MIIYGLRNCDTCRKALKLLSNARFQDVRADGVPADVLKSAYEQFENKLVNTRSATWRELPMDERNRPPLELLAAHPTLMKRPLISQGDRFYLGWSDEVQAALLGLSG